MNIVLFNVFQLIQLTGGCVLITLALLKIFQGFSEKHFLHKCLAMPLLCDMIMMSNHIPQKIALLAGWNDGVWCEGLGFISLACVCTSNVAFVIVSCASYNTFVCVRQPQKFSYYVHQYFVWFVFCMWIPGILITSYFISSGFIGLYKGLYCCVRDTTKPEIVIVMLIVFAVCGSNVLWYRQKTLAHMKNNDIDPTLGKIVNTFFSKIILLFFTSWTPTAMLGLISSIRQIDNHPIELDMTAEALLKLQPWLTAGLVMYLISGNK